MTWSDARRSQRWQIANDAHHVAEYNTVTVDHRSLNALILPALERCLLEIAMDRQCAAEELSFRLFRALETYGLECIRASEQLAASEREEHSVVKPIVRTRPTAASSSRRTRSREG
jgi:hypothetical protein